MFLQSHTQINHYQCMYYHRQINKPLEHDFADVHNNQACP